VKARHILCEKEGKIRDAYAVLKQNWLDEGKKVPGPKFGEIAQKASECSSAKAGGNLGW
jgi:parvulin-like peptidyl-prolyl isomerase